WTEHDEFEFNGKFFTVSGGYSLPKPLQTPLPAVMNAGGSPAGRQFIANYADAGYVLLPYDLDAARVAVDQRKTDAATAGRDVATWTTAYVIQRDTREEAQRYLQHIFVDHADTSAGETMVKYLGLNSQIMSPDELAAFSLHLRAGSGGFPLVGTAEDIAETLANLSAIGIDGVALSFVDFIDGLNRFTTDVIPQLEATGLRTPHVRH
ncbi:LLM class flavin-dependent oxidoreductase, partial [Mycobacterium sp. 852013-50091_SCH5140682]|uniref:LLM class flavin-dependent oxidoreductase n=1 Tax=Mycobacterium sp. 852013-50091_SCH5140682 TaxID=1834109 RepID=UPI000AC89783